MPALLSVERLAEVAARIQGPRKRRLTSEASASPRRREQEEERHQDEGAEMNGSSRFCQRASRSSAVSTAAGGSRGSGLFWIRDSIRSLPWAHTGPLLFSSHHLHSFRTSRARKPVPSVIDSTQEELQVSATKAILYHRQG